MTTASNVKRVQLYWTWIESEAALVKTDGCSKGSGAYKQCCYQHDLAYRFAKDPVDAYRHYRQGAIDPWLLAAPTTQADADAALRRCIQSKSAMGFYSPVAIGRWLILKAVGKKAWNDHRQRETEALGV